MYGSSVAQGMVHSDMLNLPSSGQCNEICGGLRGEPGKNKQRMIKSKQWVGLGLCCLL